MVIFSVIVIFITFFKKVKFSGLMITNRSIPKVNDKQDEKMDKVAKKIKNKNGKT